MSTISLVLNPRDRLELSTTIERLIDLLDAMEPDPDLELTGDDEPSLGWTSEGRGTVGLDREYTRYSDLESALGNGGTLTDVGLMYALEQDCADEEPSLGAPERHPHPGLWGGWCEPTCSQELWAQGDISDLEEQCDDEGAPDFHNDAGLLIWGGNEDAEARP